MVSKKKLFLSLFFPVTHREQQSKSISKSGRIKSNIEQKFAFRETRALARAEPHNADETHADSFHNYALITSSIIIRGAFTIVVAKGTL